MGIYKVSFLNPNNQSEEFDVVDMDELENTKLNDETITQIDNEGTTHAIKYEFVRRFNKELDNEEEIFIKASCPSISNNVEEEKLDIPTFVDGIANCAYNREIPDKSDYIIKTKSKLNAIFSRKLLDKGILMINGSYNSFGYIYANGEKIGTLEDITIKSLKEITCSYSQALVNLENAINVSIELYVERNHKIIINVDKITNGHDITINSMEKAIDQEIPEEIINLKQKEEFSNEEEYNESRRSMISANLAINNFDVDDLDLFI